jgi:hypothetical protein
MRTIKAQQPDMIQHDTVKAQQNKNDSKNRTQKWGKGVPA